MKQLTGCKSRLGISTAIGIGVILSLAPHKEAVELFMMI